MEYINADYTKGYRALLIKHEVYPEHFDATEIDKSYYKKIADKVDNLLDFYTTTDIVASVGCDKHVPIPHKKGLRERFLDCAQYMDLSDLEIPEGIDLDQVDAQSSDILSSEATELDPHNLLEDDPP